MTDAEIEMLATKPDTPDPIANDGKERPAWSDPIDGGKRSTLSWKQDDNAPEVSPEEELAAYLDSCKALGWTDDQLARAKAYGEARLNWFHAYGNVPPYGLRPKDGNIFNTSVDNLEIVEDGDSG